MRERGLAGMKFKVGGLSPEADAQRFRDARAAAGPDFVLAADANQGWSRDEAQPAVAEDVVRRRSRQLPAALDREGVAAGQGGRDLVVDDRVDLEQARVLVPRVGLADDPLARVDARDNRRAVGHLVVAAPVHTAQRDPDRDRLDALDREARHAAGPAKGSDGRQAALSG